MLVIITLGPGFSLQTELLSQQTCKTTRLGLNPENRVLMVSTSCFSFSFTNLLTHRPGSVLKVFNPGPVWSLCRNRDKLVCGPTHLDVLMPETTVAMVRLLPWKQEGRRRSGRASEDNMTEKERERGRASGNITVRNNELSLNELLT